VTQSKFHSENPQVLGANVQILVSRAIRRTGFVYPFLVYFKVLSWKLGKPTDICQNRECRGCEPWKSQAAARDQNC